MKYIANGLNPCFNGRCTRTHLTINIQHQSVLILVLMEDALVLNIFASLKQYAGKS